MRTVMEGGSRLPDATPTLDEVRRHCEEERASLPPAMLSLEPLETPYPIEIGDGLAAERDRLIQSLAGSPHD